MGSESRPLGGISSLYLGVVSVDEATLLLPASKIAIDILEDRSQYSESHTWCGDQVSVEHSLSLITDVDYSLPETLSEAMYRGFVAWIEFNYLASIRVGWSSTAGADRPLRLKSCKVVSGDKPSERPYKEWIFSSEDQCITI